MRASAPLLLVIWLVASVGAAETADPFGLGTGRDGAWIADGGSSPLNPASGLHGSAAAGSRALELDDTSFLGVGDLVLVLQTQDALPSSDAVSQLDLSAAGAGLSELGRVTALQGSTVSLASGLSRDYPASTTQVLRVPEFSTVRVPAGVTVRATPWDGRKGGVLAFLATGAVSLDGTLSASGAGFRAGVYVDDGADPTGCTSPDQAAPAGAQRGEGIASGMYGPSQSGFGRGSSGGGGGDCENAGGGGGGNAGAGGKGGDSRDGDGSRPVGGHGGASLHALGPTRLLFGGGGGAGQGNDASGTSGGAGGGIVWMRVGSLHGSGTLAANGAAASDTRREQYGDGAGGGGAGGTVVVRAVGALECGQTQAYGGKGGTVLVAPSFHGPGGGGGGGQVLLQASNPHACPTDRSAGLGGTTSDEAGHVDAHGAEPTPGDVAQHEGSLVLDATAFDPGTGGPPLKSSLYRNPKLGCSSSPGAPAPLELLTLLFLAARSEPNRSRGTECRRRPFKKP